MFRILDCEWRNSKSLQVFLCVIGKEKLMGTELIINKNKKSKFWCQAYEKAMIPLMYAPPSPVLRKKSPPGCTTVLVDASVNS